MLRCGALIQDPLARKALVKEVTDLGVEAMENPFGVTVQVRGLDSNVELKVIGCFTKQQSYSVARQT